MTAAVPLTPAQQGILFECMASPVSDLYVNQHKWLVAPEAVAYLEAALDAATARHEALRLRFVADGDGWSQTSDADGAPVERLDLPIDPVAKPQRLRAALQEIRLRCGARQPGPKSRFTLVGLRDGALLVWTYHHALLDGWSVELILRELDAVVSSRLADDVVRLRPAPSWLKVAEESRHLRDRVAARDLAYWQARLSGLPAPPTPAAPATRHPTGAYHEVRTTLPDDDSRAVQAALRSARITLGTLSVAAVALARVAAERDTPAAVIGGITAGRPAELTGRDQVAGLLAQVVPVLVTMPGETPLAEWLATLQQELSQDREHATAPLWEIQRSLGRDRSLFDTGVAVENFQTPLPAFLADPPTSWRSAGALPEGSKSNYTHAVHVMPGERVEVFLSSAADQASRAEAELLVERVAYFLRLLVTESGPMRPEMWLTPAETRRVTVDWNATDEPYPTGFTIAELVARQAAVRPHAVAVVHGADRLTYAELDSRANQLAHHLDIEVCDVVAVRMRRSPSLIVAMLAVWKAGGAYLPLEPDHPRDRARYEVEDVGARVLLTEDALASTGPDVAATHLVDLTAWAYDHHPTTAPAVAARPEHVAQVLYTSGSTGRPKGVLLEHRNLARYLHRINGITWGPGLRTLHYSPISFDAQTYEIWAALTHGGATVLAGDGPVVPAVRAAVRDHGVNAMWMASSFFNEMAQIELFTEFGDVTIAVGGEPVSPAHTAKAYAQSDRLRLVNIYGPTECSVKATTHPIPRDAGYTVSVPIGRPLPNVRAYVLDERQEPVPTGATGELYLGGPGVARGYLNRPELTEQRFLPDRFRPGERVYRTGDLVRWQADGLLDFVGRVDDQVKVRGHRIELGEIEYALAESPLVRGACVVVREDKPGDRRLAAYVVPVDGVSGDWLDDVRKRLVDRLPDYMIPDSLTVLDEIPRTARGKLDRSALPTPTRRPDQTDAALDPPRPGLETELAQLWASTLNVSQVGRNQSFTDLGGHSLLLMRVLMDVRRRYRLAGIPVEMAGARTVAEMAEMLRQEKVEPRDG
ncbi:amino acid adenylation domain-containing protein [Micromonospora sp. WMMD1120]|uniref:non-ribosomal peptide synthetase n=1 Tax=Micromonospora sp. WMMD1120 TaxID=3016106 RepID=UPI002416C30B|nr:amino acid adenylation domain-containing protein [Micromonospora sp. WMMD1120]MDG4807548.1 amino acid adenylation domain-containing protein [Micromonospora sp. WMMD1120]